MTSVNDCNFRNCRFYNGANFEMIADGTHSVILKEIEVPLWDDAKCQAALKTQFGPNFVLPSTSICAGAEGRDACDVRLHIFFC
jgi:secreted trypsin-like serine protease